MSPRALARKISTDEGGLSQSPPRPLKPHILLIFSRHGCNGSRLGSRIGREEPGSRASEGLPAPAEQPGRDLAE